MPKDFRRDQHSSQSDPAKRSRIHPETESHGEDVVAQKDAVWFGRWVGAHFVIEVCQVRRISHRGAVVTLETSLDEGQPVWLRWHSGGERPDCLEASVARVTLVAPTSVEVWLTFRERCPAGLTLAAVSSGLGLDTSYN